MSTILPSVVNL